MNSTVHRRKAVTQSSAIKDTEYTTEKTINATSRKDLETVVFNTNVRKVNSFWRQF
jgi:hypothetical protein